MERIITFFKLTDEEKTQLSSRDVCKIQNMSGDDYVIPKKVEMNFEEMQKEIDTLRCSNKQLLVTNTNLQKRIKELECEISDLRNSASAIDDWNEKKVVSPIPKVPESPKKKSLSKFLFGDKYIGEEFGSRYQIQELIEKDNISRIYKAYDKTDNKIVVVKIFDYVNYHYKSQIKAISEDILSLDYPNIVKVYSADWDSETKYMVMEYIDGIVLSKCFSKGKILPWRDAVNYSIQILKALQYAHGKYVVHGKLFMKDIILLENSTVKVRNFGMSIFNPYGRTASVESDIASVGVLLYEMLTCKSPTPINAIGYLINGGELGRWEPINKININVPKRLENIAYKAATRQFHSATDMLCELEKI